MFARYVGKSCLEDDGDDEDVGRSHTLQLRQFRYPIDDTSSHAAVHHQLCQLSRRYGQYDIGMRCRLALLKRQLDLLVLDLDGGDRRGYLYLAVREFVQ